MPVPLVQSPAEGHGLSLKAQHNNTPCAEEARNSMNACLDLMCKLACQGGQLVYPMTPEMHACSVCDVLLNRHSHLYRGFTCNGPQNT